MCNIDFHWPLILLYTINHVNNIILSYICVNFSMFPVIININTHWPLILLYTINHVNNIILSYICVNFSMFPVIKNINTFPVSTVMTQCWRLEIRNHESCRYSIQIYNNLYWFGYLCDTNEM